MLDTKKVAVAIEASILQEKRLHSTVDCPAAVAQKKGLTFTCVAVTVSHHHPLHTIFTVQQVNNLGDVAYASPQ
jgi:hypothetical protein